MLVTGRAQLAGSWRSLRTARKTAFAVCNSVYLFRSCNSVVNAYDPFLLLCTVVDRFHFPSAFSFLLCSRSASSVLPPTSAFCAPPSFELWRSPEARNSPHHHVMSSRCRPVGYLIRAGARLSLDRFSSSVTRDSRSALAALYSQHGNPTDVLRCARSAAVELQAPL